MNHVRAILFKFLTALLIMVFIGMASVTKPQVLDRLSYHTGNKDVDTSFVYLYLMRAKAYLDAGNYDSTFSSLNQAEQLSNKLNYEKWRYDIYALHAALMNLSGNFSIVLENYFKMLNILDNHSTNIDSDVETQAKYAELYHSIGVAYFNLENYEKAYDYYSKSMESSQRAFEADTSYPIARKELMYYNNIGSVFLTQGKLDEALEKFEIALEKSRVFDNQSVYATLYNNLGIIYKTNQDYDKAFQYYNESLAIRTKLDDKAGIAQVCNNLGDCYLLVGDTEKSIEYLNKALTYSKASSILTSQLKAANFLTLAYEKAGQYKESLENQRLYNTLRDSINSFDQIRLASRLEMQYLFEKQQKETELQQEIELVKKERKALVFMAISGILMLLFIILFLLNRNQKIKIKQNNLVQESLELESKNLMLEKQFLELEKIKLKEELDFRNKEIEFKNKELATNVMYLISKNEFILSITNKLLELKDQISLKNKGGILDIVREMKSNVDNTIWDEFEIRFQQVHSDFYEKLNSIHPDLSPNEKKICAFLRLNMTTKDMSSITFQSAQSIQVARTRLRKKLNLSRDENLITYLQQL